MKEGHSLRFNSKRKVTKFDSAHQDLSWSQYKSVLELEFEAFASPPFKPPWAYYVEDALMGMNGHAAALGRSPSSPIRPRLGSAGGSRSKRSSLTVAGSERRLNTTTDALASRSDRGPLVEGFEPRPSSATDVVLSETRSSPQESRRIKELRSLLCVGKHGGEALASIFWLSIGCVFAIASPTVLEAYRGQLSESWHHLVLQATSLPGELKDWILLALPFIFGQSCFRMLVDAFDEDRPVYITQAQSILVKFTQLAHFEVTGFLLTEEVLLRQRLKLFVQRVIFKPHLDQREFLRGIERQEMFESQTSQLTNKPLAFGKLDDGQPLDEYMMATILNDREEKKAKTLVGRNSNRHSRSKDSTEESAGPDMSDSFSCKISRFDFESGLWETPPELNVDRHHDLKEKGAAMFDRQMQKLTDFMTDISGEGEGHTRRYRRARTDFGAFSRKDLVKDPSKDNNVILQRMIFEPFDEAMRVRELNTCFISPVAQRWVASDYAEDRSKALHKGPSDAKVVSMQGLPSKVQSLSSPALGTLSEQGAAEKGNSQAGANSEAEVASAFGAVRARKPFRKEQPQAAWGSSLSPLAGRSASRTAQGTSETALVKQAPAAPVGSGIETLVLGPPKSLNNNQILARLEANAKAFKMTTFSEFVRRVDVLTGTKKLPIDEKKLRVEEDTYNQKMYKLVGCDDVKRMIPLNYEKRFQKAKG